MGKKIYAFALYCEGNGLVKSYAFVSIKEEKEEAEAEALQSLNRKFPAVDGWGNYQCASCIEVSETLIAQISKENAAEQDRIRELQFLESSLKTNQTVVMADDDHSATGGTQNEI